MTMDPVPPSSQAPIDSVREYVQRLTPEARSRLLLELERLELSGEAVKGIEPLLAELRAEFRKGGQAQAQERVKSPSRYFFQPLEPMLVNGGPERAGPGRISRTSLAPIWDWIGSKLLPVMTRDYENKAKPLIVANATAEVERMAAALQTKVFKFLESTLATPEGAERIRGELALFTSSRTAFDDLARMLSVLRARDALAKFQAGLPPQITAFTGEPLERTRRLLDAVIAKHADALPFALTMVMKRLKTPWQLIRLATASARGRTAAELAATPHGVAVTMVLDHLDDQRRELAHALKNDRVLIAKDILTGIYGTEDALRANIRRLETSDWGRRLDAVMAAVTSDLNAEVGRLPEGVHHIFGSRRRSGPGLLAALSRGGRDAAAGVVMWCRGIVGAGER
jgi:hypothetical protein